jgi:hypothetical protein
LVSLRLQVIEYSIEPSHANRSRNLFAKDRCRSANSDKFKPDRPEIPVIIPAFALAGGAEWLAGTASAPNRFPCGPSCEVECEFPSGDSGEEVATSESREVFGSNIVD